MSLKEILIGIVVLLILAFMSGFFNGGGMDSWSPREYVPKPGDCLVLPKGDPLYDAHYAQEVNTYNCEAFVDQAEAKNIDADTERIRAETRTGLVGVYIIIGILGFIALALVLMRS